MGSEPPFRTLLRAIIDATGLARRKAFAAIREGRVSVDGATVLDPSAPFRGGLLQLDGRRIEARAQEKVYLVLNKPAGVISATSDPHGRRTVLDLVPVEMRLPGIHPVGRLDQDTTGLLLLTNDGDLTYRLTHPKHEVEKEYWLTTKPPLTERALESLRSGIEIDGGLARPSDVFRLDPVTGFETAIVIREGRKRQVRRMVEETGARVIRLTRVREGNLRLGVLKEGQVRPLTSAEIRGLRREEGAGKTRASRQKAEPRPRSSGNGAPPRQERPRSSAPRGPRR